MTPSKRSPLGAALQAPSASQQASSDFASGMHHGMAEMMRGMHIAMSGDPDRDFLTMMIPHHQGAIEMARLVLLHGRDPLTRQLAEEILAAQQGEIKSMQARLLLLESGQLSEQFPALSGLRGG